MPCAKEREVRPVPLEGLTPAALRFGKEQRATVAGMGEEELALGNSGCGLARHYAPPAATVSRE